MIKYKRRRLHDSYFFLEVFECPKEIILFAAQLGSDNVTIENFSNYGRQRADFEFQIHVKGLSVTPTLKRFDIDFTINKTDFLQLIEVWDEQGCYAVFHDTTPLKLKATDLPEPQRYRVLENFGWKLEMAIPGSASDGWGHFASSNQQVIDKIEDELIKFR